MRGRDPLATGLPEDVESALDVMDAPALRGIVRTLLLELDERTRTRVIGTLIKSAAGRGLGWSPAAVTDEEVAETLGFALAAVRVGQAEPFEVDEHLRRAEAAFLGRSYAAAHRIFGALLPPIGNGDIYLGQDELVDEVLGSDIDACAAQYVVCAYMLSPEDERAEAVRAAIAEVRGIASLWAPIREMERVAVEPLPGLESFLAQWRDQVARSQGDARTHDWDTEGDRWLREVVERLEGSEGLAKVARATRRADDLRAWCKSLVDARDWQSALSAFEEAAGLVADREYARGDLLDGAALAAQELDRKDLPAWLERAWRAGPSMVRLRRWLGSATSKSAFRKRAKAALEACPKRAARQRALLHVVLGEHEAAAELLAAAVGLGWSDGEHPGHLLFPVFVELLGGRRDPSATLSTHGRDLDDLILATTRKDEPCLQTPEVNELLRLAGVDGIADAATRSIVLDAMRRAAANRVEGVTGRKRRRHYGHAAELVGMCVACDPSPKTAHWASALRGEYRRYPALRAELDRTLGTP